MDFSWDFLDFDWLSEVSARGSLRRIPPACRRWPVACAGRSSPDVKSKTSRPKALAVLAFGLEGRGKELLRGLLTPFDTF